MPSRHAFRHLCCEVLENRALMASDFSVAPLLDASQNLVAPLKALDVVLISNAVDHTDQIRRAASDDALVSIFDSNRENLAGLVDLLSSISQPVLSSRTWYMMLSSRTI